MLCSLRNVTVSEIGLRFRQNLSVTRFGGVGNIKIGGGEIPNNKVLAHALQHIHGIGRWKAYHIVCELGLENKYAKDLTKTQLHSLRKLLSNYLILRRKR